VLLRQVLLPLLLLQPPKEMPQDCWCKPSEKNRQHPSTATHLRAVDGLWAVLKVRAKAVEGPVLSDLGVLQQ
jgi:hypothetical protein